VGLGNVGRGLEIRAALRKRERLLRAVGPNRLDLGGQLRGSDRIAGGQEVQPKPGWLPGLEHAQLGDMISHLDDLTAVRRFRIAHLIDLSTNHSTSKRLRW